MKYDFDLNPSGKRKKRQSGTKRVIIFLFEIAAVIAAAYFLTKFAVEKTTVPDSSMEITLQKDDSIIIDKLTYKFRDPKRFEVIVFSLSESSSSTYSIKRIIGLPGETVKISDGDVYINGEPLYEPMIVDKMFIPGLADEEIELDEDEYFVLGDNRNYSNDSRFAEIGNVTAESVIGRAFIRTNGFNFVNKLNTSSKKEEHEEEQEKEQEENK